MRKKIYYLDDEPDLCNLFKEFFESDLIEIETFSDAFEAIERCDQSPPDIMFIDYRLADTTGNLVAEVIANDIVKVLVTGELEVPSYEVFYEVIAKPFKLIDVTLIIEKILDIS
jgi:DNA-binding NtrC family response regulator